MATAPAVSAASATTPTAIATPAGNELPPRAGAPTLGVTPGDAADEGVGEGVASATGLGAFADGVAARAGVAPGARLGAGDRGLLALATAGGGPAAPLAVPQLAPESPRAREASSSGRPLRCTAVLMICCRACAALMPRARSSASVPATCGAAKEVPWPAA